MSSNILLTMKPLNSKSRLHLWHLGSDFQKTGWSFVVAYACWDAKHYEIYFNIKIIILLLVSCIREWPLFLVDWDMLFGGLGRGVAFTVPLRWIWYKNKLFTLKSQWQQISIFRHALLYGFFYVFNNFLYWDHNWKCKYLQVKD